MKCSNCKQVGHNKRSCKEVVQPKIATKTDLKVKKQVKIEKNLTGDQQLTQSIDNRVNYKKQYL